jgi:hypothetical protein
MLDGGHDRDRHDGGKGTGHYCELETRTTLHESSKRAGGRFLSWNSELANTFRLTGAAGIRYFMRCGSLRAAARANRESGTAAT